MTTTVPGVDPTTGLLTNPEAYFWHITGRGPGQLADDYAHVLAVCGLPAGYPPYVYPSANGFYGLTQQIGSDGRIAGRIFLPTPDSDDLGYYSAPVSPLRDGEPGHLVWEWRPLGGPAYVPWITESATGGSGGDVVDASLDARVKALESQVATLTANAVQYGGKLGLRMAEGLVLSVDGGGGTTANTPVTFQSRGAVGGEWERLEILKP